LEQHQEKGKYGTQGTCDVPTNNESTSLSQNQRIQCDRIGILDHLSESFYSDRPGDWFDAPRHVRGGSHADGPIRRAKDLWAALAAYGRVVE
jgi:hypothetical protein